MLGCARYSLLRLGETHVRIGFATRRAETERQRIWVRRGSLAARSRSKTYLVPQRKRELELGARKRGLAQGWAESRKVGLAIRGECGEQARA